MTWRGEGYEGRYSYITGLTKGYLGPELKFVRYEEIEIKI